MKKPIDCMNPDVLRDLASVINRHSLESTCDTPDFILAEVAGRSLMSFALAKQRLDSWNSVPQAKPQEELPLRPQSYPRHLSDAELLSYKTGLWYTFENDNHAKHQRSFFLREKRGSTAFGHFIGETDYPEEHPLAYLNLASARIEP